MARILIQGTAGLLIGEERSLVAGEHLVIGQGENAGWDVALSRDALMRCSSGDDGVTAEISAVSPRCVRLIAVGEGRVRVEALADGVVVGGRELLDRRTLDLRDAEGVVEFARGHYVVLSLAADAPRAATAVATDSGSGTPLTAAPPAQLELNDAPPAPLRRRRRHRGDPPTRRPARVRLAEGDEPIVAPVVRRRRQILLSAIGHAALIALLAWIFSGVDWAPEPRPTLQFRLIGFAEVDPDDPEAAQGRGEPEPLSGDPLTPDRPDLPETFSDDEFGATVGDETGLLADDVAEELAVGVGGRPVGAFYAGRTGGKQTLLRLGGGDSASEGALRLALQWLARHQDPSGAWRGRSFERRCGDAPCLGGAEREYTVGCTAVALLPYLGAGHTHRAGPWKHVVRRGLRALLRAQREDGSFTVGSKSAYGNALATLTIAEAYALTGSSALELPAQRAVDYWVRSQASHGGWRYEVNDGRGDSSVTGWVALAMVAARKGGLNVPDSTIYGARRWFRNVCTPEGGVGYVARGSSSAALLGVGHFVQTMLGVAPDDPLLKAIAGRLLTKLPRRTQGDDSHLPEHGTTDPLHHYYGALAAFQAGGETWNIWHKRLRPLLLDHQVRSGHARGSWEPRGGTGRRGGRVVATALGALCLEVYYRYPRATDLRSGSRTPGRDR